MRSTRACGVTSMAVGTFLLLTALPRELLAPISVTLLAADVAVLGAVVERRAVDRFRAYRDRLIGATPRLN